MGHEFVAVLHVEKWLFNRLIANITRTRVYRNAELRNEFLLENDAIESRFISLKRKKFCTGKSTVF